LLWSAAQAMVNVKFKSVIELIKAFPNEQGCINHLEEMRWNGNVFSPFDTDSKVYKCAENKYKCKNTGKYFNVRTGTMFENTKIELQSWFLGIWFVTAHKKGISSLQLSRDLNITQKSDWFLLKRIRACFGLEDVKPEMTDFTQMDEMFVGGKNHNRHEGKKYQNAQGGNSDDKTPVRAIAITELHIIV